MNQTAFSYLYGLAHKSEIFDAIVIFLATDFAFLILVAFVYFLHSHENQRRGMRELLIVLGSGALAWTIARFIKYFFPAGRPDVMIDAVTPLFAHGSGIDSFPSGHAAFFFALAAALWFYHRKLGIFLGVSAVLISLARVMAGVHFPLDIAAGLILGISVSSAIHFFIKGRPRKSD